MPLISDEVEEQIDSDDENENEQVESVKPQLSNTEPIKRITTDCGQEIIIKKSRSTKKQNITKPIVVYMEDLVEQNLLPTQEIVVKQKKGKGRPKKAKPIVEYVNKDNEIQSDDDGNVEQIIINKPKKEKFSKKDLKMLELQQKIIELETVSGKKIRGTKKGTVDKRSTKPATDKQIAQRLKFVEDNRLRREAKKKEKDEKSKEKTKDNVKDVINELAELKKQNAQQKEQIIKEMEQKKHDEMQQKEKSKPINPYANLF